MIVCEASSADGPAVAAMLAQAFAEDPAFSWIFPDPAVRAQRLPRLFRLLYDSDLRGGIAFAAPGNEAAALWRAPGRAHVGWGEMLRHALPMLHALGPALRRALAVSAAIEAHMPAAPFWYLHIVGCTPAAQGRGFGRAVIAAGLVRAGAHPAYLETATPRNVGFYESLGFEVVGEWRVPRGGPTFWSMLRPAGASSSCGGCATS